MIIKTVRAIYVHIKFFKIITWTSSNPKIVTVKANETTQGAIVSAVSAGEAVITAKSQNGKTAKCKVQVKAPIYSLKLTNLNTEIDSAASTLYTGQSITLTADYMPKDTTSDTHIVWTIFAEIVFPYSADITESTLKSGVRKVTVHSSTLIS